ncbi:patellin-3-like [Abeliophyllum distichum]|uniref:Patellin-3-like n=1 Tax=Abeliophyllum distichum TaxID=126358 RepID=A0ABD1U1Z8_9LAMI
MEGEKEATAVENEKVAESASFKEEINKVDDLIDPKKKALDEFKHLIQEALNKHEFTALPPPPSPAKEEKKKEEEESMNMQQSRNPKPRWRKMKKRKPGREEILA